MVRALQSAPVEKDPAAFTPQSAGKIFSLTRGIDVTDGFVCILTGKVIGFQLRKGAN
jgi:hypothetical protein